MEQWIKQMEDQMRASLQFVIDWMKQIDAWHEFKFSDRQFQTISPEFQQYGETVLNNTLNLVKTMDRKPSPAKLMSIKNNKLNSCRQTD